MASDMLDDVQMKIKYVFHDPRKLEMALTAAHKGKEDRISNDGNRGLSMVGAAVIAMVEAHKDVIVENKTKRDANSRLHWSKTIRGRAEVCNRLEISRYIVKGDRQHGETPSTTVRSNTISALIGVVWQDLEEQNESAAAARIKVHNILRHMDSVMEDMPQEFSSRDDLEFLHASEEYEGQYNLSITTLSDLNIKKTSVLPPLSESRGPAFDCMIAESLPWNPEINFPNDSFGYTQLFDCVSSFPVMNVARAEDFTLGQANEAPEQLVVPLQIPVEGPLDASQAASNGTMNSELTAPRRKKYELSVTYEKILREEREKLTVYAMPDNEILARYLEHPQMEKRCANPDHVIHLKFLYLAIGGSKSLLDFIQQIDSARKKPTRGSHPIGLTPSLQQRFSEICRLDIEEYSCILKRRFHVMKFCETEQEVLQQTSWTNLDVATMVGAERQEIQRGNPVWRQKADINDALVFRVRPEIEGGSAQFKKIRAKIKRMRKMSQSLRLLTKMYGYGILALLPSGPSFSRLSLTDTMLYTIAENNFESFAELLYQEQGQYLEKLSRAVEPAFMALVTESLESCGPFIIEYVDKETIEMRPKGLGNPPEDLFTQYPSMI